DLHVLGYVLGEQGPLDRVVGLVGHGGSEDNFLPRPWWLVIAAQHDPDRWCFFGCPVRRHRRGPEKREPHTDAPGHHALLAPSSEPSHPVPPGRQHMNSTRQL